MGIRSWILAVLAVTASVVGAAETPPFTRASVIPPPGVTVARAVSVLHELDGVKVVETNKSGNIAVIYDRRLIASKNIEAILTNGTARAKVAPVHKIPARLSAISRSSTVGDLVRTTTREMHRMAEDLSLRMDLDIVDCLAALKSGGYAAAVERFGGFPHGGSTDDSETALKSGPLRPFARRATGGVVLLEELEPRLRALLAEQIFARVPAGSVVLACPLAELLRGLDGRTDTFAFGPDLTDDAYVCYLRYWNGDRLWIPSAQDLRRMMGSSVPGDSGNAALDRWPDGMAELCDANAIRTRALFEVNRKEHAFYCGGVPWRRSWIDRHLVPDGALLRVYPEPIDQIAPDLVAADTRYWNELETKTTNANAFANNTAARELLASLRCSISRAYAFRGMWPESEAALLQAERICPESRNVISQKALMYLRQTTDEGQARWSASLDRSARLVIKPLYVGKRTADGPAGSASNRTGHARSATGDSEK